MPRHALWPAVAVSGASLAYFLCHPLAIGRADESHLLLESRRLLDGQVMYRDYFETLTPLGFYLFAGLFRVAGTTLATARMAMAVVNALGCGFAFHLARRVSGILEASLVALVYAGLCVPAWPYASPHWLSTTLGLAVAAVLLAERRDSVRLRPLLAGALAGLAVCVQQQRGVFLAAWLPVACWLLDGARGWRTVGREIGWAACGNALVVTPVLGYVAWRASAAAVVEQLWGFAVRHYGPAQVGNPWGVVVPLTQNWAASTWLWLVRVAPAFPMLEGLALLRDRRRPWDRARRDRLALVALAGLMALSVWYLPDFIHVSFVLPFLLIPAARLLHGLRAAAVRSGSPMLARAVTVGLWAFGVAVAGQAVANVPYAHALAPARFETAFGPLRGSPAMERLYRAVGRHLVREPDGRAVLYSYPADAWLYLALGAENPTRFSAMVPGFFPPEHVEEVTAALRAGRPGTVVVLVGAKSESILSAMEGVYDAVAEVPPHRVFVRTASR